MGPPTIPDEAGTLREGFPGERKLVLPRPYVRAALTRPPVRQLLVTDCGYFPRALGHARSRPEPIDQAIVLICVRGTGWIRTDAGGFDVRSGQIAVIPPHTPHAYGGDREDPWTIWWLHIAGSSVPDLIAAVGATGRAPVRVPGDPSSAALLASEIVSTMEQDTTMSRLLEASGIAWHLLTGLSSSRTPLVDTEELVERVAQHLRENIGTHISVAELAASVGLSASHFAAVFRRRLGVPVHQYQVQLRMARAREVLDTTSRSIGEIASDVGYEDPFYFARQFRRLHGMSPSQYRSQQKG
ncbi:AraC family transcriptional regulator [Brachybacterium sacelli]|uniref:AraC-like DNA-binding protein n=1 Tax=Brachybacterium sacelli TaxID=173364 RepID=A0ABS4WYI7_9MICO|nr:AraC family transcriptional regulator [Brachybacterium sacelli]MBP2381275.1 AraC-like DNA-binding protein [Brachybacterium sacelli]